MKQLPLRQAMPSTDNRLRVRFLGTKVPYRDAMAEMKTAMEKVDLSFDQGGGPTLLLLEHPDTITTTRQHGHRSFVLPAQEIEYAGIEIIETDRGGDVTFHGLGQLVGYLVLRLPLLSDPNLGKSVDLHGYVRTLETALLDATQSLGLEQAHCLQGKTGIWLPNLGRSPDKLTAIGVGVSKGVTRHGFAMNISTRLEKFSRCIVPCGLDGYGITSLERHMKLPAIRIVCEVIVDHLAAHFDLKPAYSQNFEPRLSI